MRLGCDGGVPWGPVGSIAMRTCLGMSASICDWDSAGISVSPGLFAFSPGCVSLSCLPRSHQSSFVSITVCAIGLTFFFFFFVPPGLLSLPGLPAAAGWMTPGGEPRGRGLAQDMADGLGQETRATYAVAVEGLSDAEAVVAAVALSRSYRNYSAKENGLSRTPSRVLSQVS